jgi:WD40 repeat protein/HYR domain-containing protein
VNRTSFIALVAFIASILLAPVANAQQFSDQWSTPVNLNLLAGQTTLINGTGNDQHPAISKDGLSLYFSSDRPGGCGALDVWVTRRASVDSHWGQPFNLDAGRLAVGLPCVINSTAIDMAPNVSTDSQFLFFHSFRTGGCGGSDLYYSVRSNPADDLSWETPRNLNRFGRDSSDALICGSIGDINVVNTPNSDAGPTYFQDQLTETTTLYFTRSDQPTQSGDFDIYTATLLTDGTWGNIVRNNALSTTPYRDTRTAIRHDGLEMILASERPGFPPGSDPRKLWSSTRDSTLNPWLTLGLVPYVHSTGQDGAPALSFEGNELYFFSSRAGGTGANDLYLSTRRLPIVRVKNITVEAANSCLATISPSDLDDGSFDPGGGSLRFSFEPAGPFGLGTTTVRLTATDDHGVTNSAIATITVVDQTPPTVTAPPAMTVFTARDATSCGAFISDADLGTPTASDNCSFTIARSDVPAGNIFPTGTTILTYTAIDGSGNAGYATQSITVIDGTAPVISGAAVDKPTLWPANHKMVDVIVSYTAADNCGTPNVQLSISSNEPVNGTGDGDTAPDWEVVDAYHVRLRAERSGHGNGRVYTITITAVDNQGNVMRQLVTVSVPKNRKQDSSDRRDGEHQDGEHEEGERR